MRFSIIVIFLFCSLSLFAQRTISGIVTNELDGSPLVFVNVFLQKDQSHGVITNERGEYSITIYPEQENDVLVFSQLGFQTLFQPIQRIAKNTFNHRMPRSFLTLDEVIVISDRGLRDIVREAMRRIPQNYGHKAYYARAYYRRYTTTDRTYSLFQEGMITYRDGPWGKSAKPTRAWVDQFRSSDDFRHQRWREDPTQAVNNPIIRAYEYETALRDQTLFFLDLENQEYGNFYLFHNRGEYKNGEDSLIRIGLEAFPVYQKKQNGGPNVDSVSYYLLEGELLINRTDYGILKFSMSGKNDSEYIHEATFRKVEGKYYPHHVQHLFGFRHEQGTRHHLQKELFYFYDILSGKEEMKTYRKGKRQFREEGFDPASIRYDSTFWANNTLLLQLPAPEAIEHDLSRLNDLNDQYHGNARQ